MPTRNQQNIEDRLAKLELRFNELQALVCDADAKPDWRKLIGIFTDKPGVQAIFAEAMKLRETERRQSRSRTRRLKSKTAKVRTKT